MKHRKLKNNCIIGRVSELQIQITNFLKLFLLIYLHTKALKLFQVGPELFTHLQ